VKTRSTFLAVFAIAIFYVVWGVSQLISIKTRYPLLSSLLFSTFFLSFYVDSLFQDIELAATMGFIGLLLGASYLFLGNFWVVCPALFIIMLVNTLADNKYDEYSYWVVIVSTILSLTILALDFIKNRKCKTKAIQL